MSYPLQCVASSIFIMNYFKHDSMSAGSECFNYREFVRESGKLYLFEVHNILETYFEVFERSWPLLSWDKTFSILATGCRSYEYTANIRKKYRMFHYSPNTWRENLVDVIRLVKIDYAWRKCFTVFRSLQRFSMLFLRSKEQRFTWIIYLYSR